MDDNSGEGPYRDPREGLLAMRRSLAGDRDVMEGHLVQLRLRLQSIDEQLGAPDFVDQLEIATPCTERWEGMQGTDVERHCGRCSKSVYDVSKMTRAEVQQLIRESEELPCLKLRRRRDGRVVTGDCPTSRRTRAARIAIAVLAFGGASGGIAAYQAMHVEPLLFHPELRVAEDTREVMGMLRGPPHRTLAQGDATLRVPIAAVEQSFDGTFHIVRGGETTMNEAALLDQLGISPDDLVLGINGIRVTQPFDSRQIATRIGNARRFELQIEREGGIATQVYRVTEPGSK